MELVIAIAIKHAVDLENIAVRIRAGELVACAIEAQDKLLGHMAVAMRRRPIVHGVFVLCMRVLGILGSHVGQVKKRKREEVVVREEESARSWKVGITMHKMCREISSDTRRHYDKVHNRHVQMRSFAHWLTRGFCACRGADHGD